MPGSSILIVDDEENNLYLLNLILGKQGYVTISASNGKEAVEAVKTHNIDLILMDVMMPEMDGFEASEIIHKTKKTAHIPIILITAKKRETKDVVRGLEGGAVEYMSKPFVESELMAKVRSMLRIKHLNDKNRELLEKVLLQQKQMDMELDIAKRVQLALLPSLDRLAYQDKIQIEAYYDAKDSIGGDFYDFMDYSQNRMAFFIADVSGHGPSAAMITALIKALLTSESEDFPPPSELITRLNKKLVEMIPAEHFATIFFGVADFNTNTLSYTTAGHPAPFHIRGSENDITDLKNCGTMVGMFDTADFRDEKLEFKKGDKLFFYSDGVYEILNGKMELYGHNRLRNFISAHGSDSCKEILSDLVTEINSYWDGKSERDDIVAIAIEFI